MIFTFAQSLIVIKTIRREEREITGITNGHDDVAQTPALFTNEQWPLFMPKDARARCFHVSVGLLLLYTKCRW